MIDASRGNVWNHEKLPSTVNGTELSAVEFRDALNLRHARTPPGLQPSCDGCNQKFSVRHALECKKGGLVILRHNEIRDELNDLASKAFSPSAVRDEPKIQNCRNSEVKSDEDIKENSVKRLFRNNRNLEDREWRHFDSWTMGPRYGLHYQC